jgi:hypothetical protein
MKLVYSALLGFVWMVLQNSVLAQELYQVTSLNINTREYIEESAVYYKDGIVFVSNRAQSALRQITNQNGEPLRDFFFTKQKDNKKWAAPDEFSRFLNTKMEEYSITFDKAGKIAYFTRTEENDKTAIYSATFNGSEWSNLTLLPFNQKNYNFFDPCLSSDGKKLFFSSNRQGGQGGNDIWVCSMGRSGWGPAKNLGPMVNSDTSDFSPFYHHNGKLYFASNRKGSYGAADIYWTMEINGRWLPAKPLPAPFNTRYNDYCYVSDSADRSGFISSNRNKSSDVFSFINNFPLLNDSKPILKNTYRYRFHETSVINDSSTFIYEWDFGDSTKIRGRNLDVRHIFPKTGDYLVQLNVIDSLTGEVSLNQSANVVQVRDEIQPVITCADTIYTNEDVLFDSDKSYLPDFKSPQFYWDFGDGTLEMGKSLKHSYYYPGLYKVVLGSKDAFDSQNSKEAVCVFKNIIVLEGKKVL